MKLYVQYFYINYKKNVLPQGVGKTAPYLGQDGPLTVVASYSSTTHDLNLFCGQQSSSSSDTVQGSVLLPHYRTLEVRPGRIS